jgi:hypothetical protein
MPHRLSRPSSLAARRSCLVVRGCSLRRHRRSDIKLSWSLPAAAASRRRGPRPPRRLQPPCPRVARAAHQRGARAFNPAPASPSLATGPLGGGPFFQPHRHACAAPGLRGVRRCGARGHRSQRSFRPSWPLRGSATRCAFVDAYGPSLWRERPPGCARLARALLNPPRSRAAQDAFA